MVGKPLSEVLQALFILAGLLFDCASIGVAITAGVKSNSWRRRFRYVLLGGILNFLFCISLGAYMLVDNPVFRILPVLLLLGLAWGFVGAVGVFQSLWAHEWWRRFMSRYVNHEMEEER
jgi:hypothetical protein